MNDLLNVSLQAVCLFTLALAVLTLVSCQPSLVPVEDIYNMPEPPAGTFDLPGDLILIAGVI